MSVGFPCFGEPVMVDIDGGGGVNFRWRDAAQGQWLKIHNDSTMNPYSAVAIACMDGNGNGVLPHDPACAVVHLGMYDKDGNHWIAWVNVGAGGSPFAWDGQLHWAEV